MADLASLGIKVTTQGVKEATRDLGSLTHEGREAEKQADRVSKKWSAAGKALGVGIAAGVGIAGLAMRKYFQNTIEAEKVQAQLAARIKSTGQAASLTVADLNKMAEALQFKTTFDDESIGEVQSLLLTFTKIGRETFPQATEAVLDLSTAMGTDLNSAALQVGKALNDPVKGITALSRAGVQFSESQKATIKDLVKTGDVAGAQALILKELQTQMGGAAVAARNTLGGALKALENSFNNLLEGDSGDAGVKGARDAIEELNKTLNDPAVKKGFADMVAGLASIASAAASAIGPLMDLIKLQRESFGFSQKLAGNGRRAPEARDSVQGLAASNAALLRGDLRTFAVARARALQGELGIGEIADFSGVSATTSGRAGRARNPRGGSNRPEAFVPIAPEEEDKKKTGGGRSRAAREMPSFAKEDAEDLRRLIEATAEADTAFEGLSATLSGPLAAAQFQYKQNLQEITELGQTAGRSSEEIAAAKALETKRYEEERAEIEKSLDVFGQLTEAKQFELDLMGMSNVERQTAIDLQRLGRKATEEETAAIREQNQAYEDRSRTIDMMDDFRRSASDNLADFTKGTESAKEAALDFLGSVADMLIEMASKQLIAKAFGDQGSTGAGTGGGDWMSALFGAFAGGGGGSDAGSLADLFDGAWGFASGGWTGNGPRNKVAGFVHGQEGVLNADAMRNVGITNLQRLNAGAKFSDLSAANGGNVTNITNATTFLLPARYTPQTQAQIDQHNARVQQRASARNS